MGNLIILIGKVVGRFVFVLGTTLVTKKFNFHVLLKLIEKRKIELFNHEGG